VVPAYLLNNPGLGPERGRYHGHRLHEVAGDQPPGLRSGQGLPGGVLDPGRRVVVFHDGKKCIACGACVLQCPEDAIELR